MESVLWWQWPCASCLENTDLSPVAADEGKGGIFTFKPTFFWHYQKSVFLGSLWCEPTKSGVGQWLGVSPPRLQAMLSLLGADRASLSKGMSQKKLCSSSLAYFWLLLFDFNLEKNNPARQINTESILVTTIFFFYILHESWNHQYSTIQKGAEWWEKQETHPNNVWLAFFSVWLHKKRKYWIDFWPQSSCVFFPQKSQG